MHASPVPTRKSSVSATLSPEQIRHRLGLAQHLKEKQHSELLIWDEETKAKATEFIASKIKEQQGMKLNIDRQIKHANGLMSERLACRNKAGAAGSMRDVLQHEAQKRDLDRIIAELNYMVLEIWATDTPINYKEKANEIVGLHKHRGVKSLSISSFDYDDEDQLYEQAKSRSAAALPQQQRSHSARSFRSTRHAV